MVTASSEAPSNSSGSDRDNTMKFLAKQHNSFFSDKATLVRLFSGTPDKTISSNRRGSRYAVSLIS
jgi:hypothetical protein